MKSVIHEGFIIDFDFISKDKKKLCANPNSFEDDILNAMKLVIGKYKESGVLLGDILRCGGLSNNYQFHKQRFIVSVWNTGMVDGYRIVYFKIKDIFYVCLVYIKSKIKVRKGNETQFIVEELKRRLIQKGR